MGRRNRVLGILALAIGAATCAAAQDNQANSDVKEPVETAAPQLGDDQNIFQSLKIELLDLDRLREEVNSKLVGEPMRVTLEQCVQMALIYNQDILIQGYDIGMTEADLQAAKGQFDPLLALSGKYSDSSSPASSQVLAFTGGSVGNIESKQQDYKLGLSGSSWIGTRYDFGFAVNRERGTFTTPRDPDTGEPLDTESVYTADWTLSLTQPLLRGVGLNSNLVRIKRAKNNQKISEAQAQLVILNTVGEVVKSYWDLVGAVEQLKVQQESLDNALRVLHINEQRYELGTAAALEVLEAKAGVAARQGNLVSARSVVLDAEDVLKTRMGLYDESGELISGANVIPIDRPVIHDPDYDLEDSMRTAIERRPDVLSAQIAITSAENDLKANRNDLLPQFDLSASYGRNTIQLDGNEIWDGLGNPPDGRSWTIGGVASVPLGNRTARGNYQRSKLFMRQQEQRLMKIKQEAMLGVRLAIHQLASNRILVESTKQARVLEEANVAAEEKRLKIGVTTAQNVLDKQEDLTAAQAREVRAQVDFERSQISLQVAEGTLLENMGIVPVTPDFEEEPGFFHSLLGPAGND